MRKRLVVLVLLVICVLGVTSVYAEDTPKSTAEKMIEAFKASEDAAGNLFFEVCRKVYFNFGDGIYVSENFDASARLLPEKFSLLEKGTLVGFEKIFGSFGGCTVAHLVYKHNIFKMPVVRIIPDQEVVLLNW